MWKAIIVPDLAFTSHKGRRGGKSSGAKELKRQLKYFQFRDNRDGHVPQEEGKERWIDKGMGHHYREILTNCQRLSSNRLLAWTWVVSPAPDLMALIPETEREAVVISLTEEIVETYYAARGVEIPEYSYVLHDRWTNATDDAERQQQLHSHIILPTTVPTVEGSRETFDNRANKGHIQLLRDISTEKFEAMLEQFVGPEWRRLRPDIEPSSDAPEQTSLDNNAPNVSELDLWFGR